MEEGEISTITQLRQIKRRGMTQTPVRCTIKNSLETAPVLKITHKFVKFVGLRYLK